MTAFAELRVAGIGLVGPFGFGLERFLEASNGTFPQPIPEDIPDAPVRGGRVVRALRADTARLEQYVDKRKLRRADRFSRLTLLAVCDSLEDAGLLGGDLSRTAIMTASGFGAATANFSYMDTIIDDGDALASPTLFSTSVANVAAATVATILGADGPNATVTQFGLSLASGIMTAAAWLAEGRVDAVALCAVDDVCPFLTHCVAALRDDKEASPLAGEGAAAFVLAPSTSPRAPGRGIVTDVVMGRLPALPEATGKLYASGSGAGCVSPGPAQETGSLASRLGDSPVLPAFHLAEALLREESACVLSAEEEGSWAVLRCRPEAAP